MTVLQVMGAIADGKGMCSLFRVVSMCSLFRVVIE